MARPLAGAAPKWLGALDAVTPIKAAPAGVLLGTISPKNLPRSHHARRDEGVADQVVIPALCLVIGPDPVGDAISGLS